jgi:pseudouridine-5'-phosphate glycosidase
MSKKKELSDVSEALESGAVVVADGQGGGGGSGKTQKGPKTAEDKAADFRRLAMRRVPRVLKGIQAIANLANTYSYSYTPEQVERICSSLEYELAAMRRRFEGAKDVTEQWSL